MKEASNYLRYLILGLGRSGTTAIHFALKGHPNVCALNDEVNVSFFSEGISTFTQRDNNSLEKEKGSKCLFDAIAGIFSNEKTKAIGMKCVPSDLQATKTLTIALKKHFPELKIILLIRKDLTAQYGSMITFFKQLIDKFSFYTKHPSTSQIKLNKRLFKNYIERSILKLNELKTLSNSHDLLEVEYEKCLLAKNGPDFSTIFNFLNLPNLEATWLNCNKVAPPPKEYIRNYEKMKILFNEYRQSNFSK